MEGVGDRGIEYSERARVGRQKLKRRAEIERQHERQTKPFHDRALRAIRSADPDAEMEASLVNWRSYKSVRHFSRRNDAKSRPKR